MKELILWTVTFLGVALVLPLALIGLLIVAIQTLISALRK